MRVGIVGAGRIEFADAVILAVPWQAIDEVLAEMGPLTAGSWSTPPTSSGPAGRRAVAEGDLETSRCRLAKARRLGEPFGVSLRRGFPVRIRSAVEFHFIERERARASRVVQFDERARAGDLARHVRGDP